MSNESNTGPVIEVMERLSKAEALPLCEDAVILPTGKTVHDLRPMLDKRRDAPRRAVGTAMHTTLDSIIAHANRHKDASSVLFASDDPARPSITAVYDYNEPGAPRFCEHRAHYAFPLAEEWQAWVKASGGDRWLSQGEFSEFLENRILDVLDPSKLTPGISGLAEQLGLALGGQAALLDAAKRIQIRKDTTVTNAVNLSTGEVELTYDEKHETRSKTGGPIVVPQAFAVGIPVFRGGVRYSLIARLRYKSVDGQVLWGIRLHRPDACFRDAFTAACEKAAADTGLPLFYGTPE